MFRMRLRHAASCSLAAFVVLCSTTASAKLSKPQRAELQGYIEKLQAVQDPDHEADPSQRLDLDDVLEGLRVVLDHVEQEDQPDHDQDDAGTDAHAALLGVRDLAAG